MSAENIRDWKVEELTDQERSEMEAEKASLPACGVPFAGPEGEEDTDTEWNPNAPQTEEDDE